MSQQLRLSGKAVTLKNKATEPPSPQAVVSTCMPTLFRKSVTIDNPKVVGGKEVKKFIVPNAQTEIARLIKESMNILWELDGLTHSSILSLVLAREASMQFMTTTTTPLLPQKSNPFCATMGLG